MQDFENQNEYTDGTDVSGQPQVPAAEDAQPSQQDPFGQTAQQSDALSQDAQPQQQNDASQPWESGQTQTPAQPDAYPYGAQPQQPYGTQQPYGAQQPSYGRTESPNAGAYGAPNAQNPGTAQNGGVPNANGGYPYGASKNGYPYGAPNGAGGYGYPYQNRQPAYAYAESAPQQKKKNVGSRIFVIAAALVLVGVLVLIVTGISKKGNKATRSDAATGEAIEDVDELVTAETPDKKETKTASADALSPNAVYQKVLPSSVGILVYGSGKKLSSEGSGVIFKEDNAGKYTYIITCAHVISDKGVSIMVQLSNEKEYAAQLVGYDNKTDIGVLRIEAKGLTVADFGDSQKLGVGDTIYAIGNPGGTEFANSFTSGMISAIDRPVSSSSTGYTMECIQHTAAINPGNSGGALVNEFGQVVGINSMKIVADEYEGMGFSVPSSVFINIVNEIIANGYVTNRPKIGVTYLPASSEQAYAMFVAIKGLPAGSIIVYSISADSSLADGKLQKGDMIVGVNGKDLDNTSDLAELVEKGKVGDMLTLNVVRIHNDYTFEEFEVKATLVEDKGDTNLMEEETTTSYFDDYFGDRSGGSDGSDNGGYGGYDDFFDDFFGDFFGNP